MFGFWYFINRGCLLTGGGDYRPLAALASLSLLVLYYFGRGLSTGGGGQLQTGRRFLNVVVRTSLASFCYAKLWQIILLHRLALFVCLAALGVFLAGAMDAGFTESFFSTLTNRISCRVSQLGYRIGSGVSQMGARDSSKSRSTHSSFDRGGV
jgi:hypothetical protein